MKSSVFVDIDSSPQDVWNAIVDFEYCSNYIESIVDVEILHQPVDTLIGFKWRETRIMFGKEAIETMWITDYAENEFYKTRAESHGSVYTSGMSIERVGEKTRLTMSFSGEAHTFSAKLMTFLMGFMMKGAMKKAITKDLNDIRSHLESK